MVAEKVVQSRTTLANLMALHLAASRAVVLERKKVALTAVD